MIEDMLGELGGEVVESVAELAAACEAASRLDIDVAMLDVNLAGQLVFPAAAILQRRQIPVIFSTGYAPTSLPAEFSGNQVLNKPFALADLQKKLALALGR
ncbi:response regulator [Mesorhizobium caraganae]|uniref:response regulator n=1 Tax=Mesorhizobium caraganae TaxID=483206 RepID=UPI00193A87BE|nr:response regulator [Mesorhizobium caraganae]